LVRRRPCRLGVALLETLQILEGYPAPRGVRLRPTQTTCTTSSRRGRRATRIDALADPGQWPVDVAKHLDVDHAAALFQAIDPARAARFPPRSDDDDRTRAPEPGRSDRPWHDRLRRGRHPRQHDCRHADAEHVGRRVLRVEGTGLPVQQPPEVEPHRTGDVRPVAAALALVDRQRPDARVSGHREPPDPLWRRSGPRATRGSRPSVYTILTGLIDGQLPVQQRWKRRGLLVGRDPSDPARHRRPGADRRPPAALAARGPRVARHVFQKIRPEGPNCGYATPRPPFVDLDAATVDGGCGTEALARQRRVERPIEPRHRGLAARTPLKRQPCLARSRRHLVAHRRQWRVRHG